MLVVPLRSRISDSHGEHMKGPCNILSISGVLASFIAAWPARSNHLKARINENMNGMDCSLQSSLSWGEEQNRQREEHDLEQQESLRWLR